MINKKEILNQLPGSWNQLTLNQYNKLLDCEITEDASEFQGMENTIEAISKLSGVSVDELELLTLSQLQPLGARLSWLLTPYQPTGITALKLKQIDKLTYNDYITFIQIKEPLKNLHVVIKVFSIEPLTDEQILALPMDEVLNVFFCLKQSLVKLVKRSILSVKIKLAKLLLKEKIIHWMKIKGMKGR